MLIAGDGYLASNNDLESQHAVNILAGLYSSLLDKSGYDDGSGYVGYAALHGPEIVAEFAKRAA